MKHNIGWFKVDRCIIDSEIWQKPSEWLKIWMYILSNVNYADTESMKRGSNYFRASIIADDCQCSKRTVENFLKWAKVVDMVVTHKTARGNVITVVSYEKYQSDSGTRSDTTSDTVSDTTSVTSMGATGDTIKEEENNTRRKEEKNNKTLWGDFKKSLLKSGYTGRLAKVLVEQVEEDVYLNSDGLLYTSTKTPKQIVQSTINEIWLQLYEINEMKKRSDPARAMGVS